MASCMLTKPSKTIIMRYSIGSLFLGIPNNNIYKARIQKNKGKIKDKNFILTILLSLKIRYNLT